ncbi:Coiled-coil domain-containing protein 61 [Tritrichomonas musculus]|uniref:Coiled-coil domain-containing protein 61 n=1 Tax=Tritrichomonas musculus TaxID=1915356 RepID=A0ABR2K4I5_9EUKA
MSIENEINVVLESNQRKYRLYAQYSTANSFSLQIISEDFTLRYAGEFTAAYIEEITVKSGAFKRLPIFWQILLMACQNTDTSPALTIDIYTATELQNMVAFSAPLIKSPKSPPNSQSDIIYEDKIFLIITQISDFDKIRYPLPLAYTPFTNDELMLSVRRLYKENEKLKGMLDEINASHSIVSLEQKKSMLSADYMDLQNQKNIEIEQLQKKLKQLKVKRAREIASTRTSRKFSPRTWERLNRKSSPRKLHQGTDKEQNTTVTNKTKKAVSRPKSTMTPKKK